ncbi:MAG: hypothetical protein JRN59_05300 [Nitrososphaerota archaeon]|nr:hypothetical protein [Nitrososphaerota archaeon]
MFNVFSSAKGKQHPAEVDTHSIIEVGNSEESVKITARFEGKTWKEISSFARQMGYTAMKELLPILFSYGVTDEEGVDIEKRRSEMFALGGRYAAMKFESYQLFSDNRALSMALSTMLPENKKLRKLLAEKGLTPAKHEQWDDWAQDEIDSFYKKYVFILKET